MIDQSSLSDAEAALSAWLKNCPGKAAEQKAALNYYGNLFRPENLPNITQEEFKGFLLFKNNKHWAGIHRQPNIYANMDRLRTALGVLLDENRRIQDRLNEITDKNGPLYIKGLGRAVLTPILLCVYPPAADPISRAQPRDLPAVDQSWERRRSRHSLGTW